MLGKIRNQSPQLGVLRLGLFQNGDVGVGVFPEGEEVLVGSFCSASVSIHRVGAAELEMREYADGLIQHDAPMVEDSTLPSAPATCRAISAGSPW